MKDYNQLIIYLKEQKNLKHCDAVQLAHLDDAEKIHKTLKKWNEPILKPSYQRESLLSQLIN